MAEQSTSPHIRDENSPLEQLALRALRRYGDMSPSTSDADTMLMFVDYGNSVLDDLMAHPYWKKGVAIPYYKHQQDARPIPDHVLLSGMLFKYAFDRESRKAQGYQSAYYSTMNTVMARVKFGVGAEFKFQAVDYSDGEAAIPGVS